MALSCHIFLKLSPHRVPFSSPLEISPDSRWMKRDEEEKRRVMGADACTIRACSSILPVGWEQCVACRFYFTRPETHPIPRITASTVACCRPRETSSHFLIEIAATLVACGPTQKGKIRGRVICTPCPALLTNASPHNETRPTPYQLSNYKVWAPPRSRKSTFICN